MTLKNIASIIVILSVLSTTKVITCQSVGAGSHAAPPDVEQREKKFLDAMKFFWRKTFGDLDMPPAINASIYQPPPRKVMEALSAIATREDNKMKLGKGGKLYVDNEATMTKEFEASASSGKLDPRIEDAVAKRLAGMFSGPTGPDPKAEAEMKQLLQTLMTGANNIGSASAENAGKKMDADEEERLKGAIMATMKGGDTSLKLQRGEFGAAMKAMGYGGDHATSTVLAVAKCYGSPDLDNELHEESVQSLFFSAQDLNPGKTMKLQFSKSTNNGAFMDSIQEDRSGVLSAVLLINLVAIVGKTMEKQKDPSLTAEMDTIIMCDQPATKGKNKDKTCAMDLESMINYTMAKIGKDIRPAATWLTKDFQSPVEYTVTTIKKLPAISTVGCCKMSFPFAVFYCLDFAKSVNYIVSLMGENGSVKAPVICHEDTSTWNPKSWIFTKLKTKPGGSKICHFVGADDVVWMPKNQENAAD